MYLQVLNRMRKASPFILMILSLSFWIFLFPEHLRYQESIQFFCYDWAYLWGRFSFIGGLSSFISSFLIQFFLFPVVGAIIMAAITVIIFLQVRSICKNELISAIPSLLVNLLLMDSDYTLALPVSLILSLFVFNIITRRDYNLLTTVLLTTATYVLAGPISILLVVLCFCGRHHKAGLAAASGVLLVGVAAVFLSPHTPAWQFITGLDYCHSRTPIPFRSILRIHDHKELNLERIYAYDQAARSGQWDRILKMASKKSPDNLPSLVCYNMALAKTGQLGTKLFNVQQVGPQGMFPSYESTYLSMVLGSEALFNAGLYNTAMHYSFEANWSYPDMGQSVRQIKMLQRINAINNQSGVAEKYSYMLNRTLFYRTGVVSQPAIGNGENEDPYDCMLLNDSDDYSKQQMLKELLSRGDDHDMETVEYLLSYDLLCKDLQSFFKDFHDYWPRDRRIPRCYQEALMMPYLMGRDSRQMNNPDITPEVKKRAIAFLESLKNGRGDAYMQTHFGNTYWAYHARQL